MKTLLLTKEDFRLVTTIRYDHPKRLIRRRAAVLYFKSLNYAHQEIQKLACVSSTTVTTVIKMYEQGGLKKVLTSNYYSRQSALEAYQDEILKEIEKYPPRTLKEASYQISQLVHIQRSRFSISKFFKKIKVKLLKTGSLPAKADPQTQEEFKKKCLKLP